MYQLPKTTGYEDCLKVLNILYEQYKWYETESGGRNPMIPGIKISLNIMRH